MDRGYANFDVESTQVAIAPEKDDIFITVNVNEGDVFKISDVKIAGNLVVPESELRRLICVQPGDIFSRKMITQTTELMTAAAGRGRLRIRQDRPGAAGEPARPRKSR